MTNKTIGKYGEDLAKDFLIKNNFEILEMNYRYSKIAEIDIIAKKGDTVHFIEVKTRTQTFFGSPLEAINQNKLKQIYSCAKYYLQNSKKHYKKMQIDAIGIVLNKKELVKIDFIEDISI
ncbi:MAG: YraN family protein [Candidatus Gastranaerophilales bacterium]|nr:YraN family protein [Candidatus Gastranaerophilales bacterium]